MNINVNLSDKELEELVLSIFDNYPEAGAGMSLQMTNFYYAKKGDEHYAWPLSFVDTETGKHYKLTMPMAKKGLRLFFEKVISGQFAIFSGALTDPGQYDSDAADAVLQCALLGDIIYG